MTLTSHILSKKWLQWGILSLCIVALFGTLMRYKIVFNFPILDQQNLLHAHSHFAFNGWINHFLYSGLSLLVLKYAGKEKYKKYRAIIILNLISAYGMLFSFTVQNYGAVSIFFSSVSIFVGYWFAWNFIKDTKFFPTNHPSISWAKTGLCLNVISSAGPFFLAYMMITKMVVHKYTLAALYYYLHFQYSGWFFFGCMALLVSMLPSEMLQLKKYYRILTATAIPNVFLSLLFLDIPKWLYIITLISIIITLITWFSMVKKYYPALKEMKTFNATRLEKLLFYSALVALTLKFILQTISVVPSLSTLVFGFRPIVIAYLHLVLLGVYSLFILGYSFYNQLLHYSKLAYIGTIGFFVGVVLNESALGIQGLAAFSYTTIPFINEILFIVALILFLSALIILISQHRIFFKISDRELPPH